MSLLLGTIKNKLGFFRHFKDMNLDELDFTKEEVDYLLDDTDEEEDLVHANVGSSSNSKKRVRNPKNDADEEKCDIKKEKLDKIVSEVDELLPPSEPNNLTKVKTQSEVSVKSESLELPNGHNSKLEGDGYFLSFNENVKSPFDTTVNEIFERLEYIYVEKRYLVVKSDGFISTPLHAVKQIARKFEEIIHNEVTFFPFDDQPNPLVRMELMLGVFRGVGESFNKRLAAQMAAVDFLMKFEHFNPSYSTVPYAIFPGWRIPPGVCRHLMLVCQKSDLKVPRYISKTNISVPEKPVCLVECHIDKELVAVGESDLSYVARKLAAYNALEALTGQKYPLEYASLGSGCLSYRDLKTLGIYPPPSDTKKRWMLDEIKSTNLTFEERGVDKEEFEALRTSIYQQEMKDIADDKVKFKVTIGTDVNEPSKRQVQVNRANL